MILFFIIRSSNLINLSMNKELIVYAIPGYNAMRFTSGKACIFLIDSGLLADKSKLKFHVLPHELKLGITQQKILYSGSSWKKILFGGMQIILSGKSRTGELVTDLFFIKNRVETPMLEKIHCKKVLLSSSLDQREIKRLRLFYSRKKIPYYLVIEYGAFQLSL